MKGVDLKRLDALLASKGWTRAEMERAIGKPITERMPGEVKELIWKIAQDRKAREKLSIYRLVFKDAIITSITMLEKPGEAEIHDEYAC